jgi:hypothetical protein
VIQQVLGDVIERSAVELFNYADHPVRVVLIDDEPWFVLADLTRRCSGSVNSVQTALTMP